MDNLSETKQLYPQTFYDREARQNSNYFFVSYSHKDKELVFDVLHQLYDVGVNYWYDVELDPGDIWNERVEKVLRNKHCKGALVFMSENSLISNAVQQEIKIMEELAEKRGFRLVPIIMGHETAKSLVLTVANNNDSFYENDGMSLFKGFTVDGIWIKYDTVVDEIPQLAESENIMEGHFVNIRRSFIQQIDHISSGGSRLFLCGKYPLEEDGLLRDIEWKLVSNDGDYYYFVSKYCIDFVNDKNIDSIIETIKKSMSSQQYVENVELINEDFLNSYLSSISEALPTNYADRNRQQLLRLFWVLADDGAEKHKYSLYNSQNIKINENIQREKINAGIRLILVVNNEKIGEK